MKWHKGDHLLLCFSLSYGTEFHRKTIMSRLGNGSLITYDKKTKQRQKEDNENIESKLVTHAGTFIITIVHSLNLCTIKMIYRTVTGNCIRVSCFKLLFALGLIIRNFRIQLSSPLTCIGKCCPENLSAVTSEVNY